MVTLFTILYWHILLGLIGLVIHSITGFIFDKYKFKDVLSFIDLIVAIIGGYLVFLIVLVIEFDNIRIRKQKKSSV